MEQKSQCSEKNIHNQYQLKKIYVNLFDANLSRIFSWFKTTVFHAFFVYFLWFYRKKKSAKRYFDCVSPNDLRFSTSNINCIQDDDIPLIRRLLSKLDGGSDSYCWFIYIKWLKILDKNLLFIFYCSKQFGVEEEQGNNSPLPIVPLIL